jgi:phage-related minor tail protein
VSVIKDFRAPALPLAAKDYNEQATNQMANILRLYFNQLDQILSSIANAVTTTPYRASIAGAVSIDLSSITSTNLILKMTGNVTSFALTGPVDGAAYSIRFIQDATGGRTFAGFPAVFKFAGGVAPVFTTTANAVNFLTAQYGSTEGTYMARFSAGMA